MKIWGAGWRCPCPQPYGLITAGAEKDYPVDLSYFNIMGTAVGAHGVEATSEAAVFSNVDLEVAIGSKKDIKLKLPFIIPGLGSTAVAKNNWEGLAVGCAITGIPLTIGENVCGMDPNCVVEDGQVTHSDDLEWRVKLYQDWQRDGYAGTIVQANVEDTGLGVQEYALKKLNIEIVELKWGQGAKDIGGEVKIKDLAKAQMLKSRGYVVFPDPSNPEVIEAFKRGVFSEFERHSRVGMVTEDGFMDRVQELRSAGAKHVFLKTGAYRPADLARVIKFASKAKIDLLTVDAAGGGTGMSPWRMMNEWGMPQVEIYSLLYQYADRLANMGEYVPDIAPAGGIIFEDQAYKGLAIGAPYFKIIGMARGPIAAAMVGKTIGKAVKSKEVPVYISRFGRTIEDIFVTSTELKHRFGADFDSIPAGAIGLYTYMQRIAQGMRQLMPADFPIQCP